MPLVHFFETSFGRTYERDIVLVEVVGDGVSGWGEVTAGENPFYNEEWTDAAWLILRDYAAPRVLGPRTCRAPATCSPLHAAHSRAPHGARRPRSGGLGSGGAACTACRSWKQIGGGARTRDSVRRLDRHAGSVDSCWARSRRELDAGYQRIKMKIKPGWDVDVVARGARAISRHQADGRCQFRVHAGGRRPSASSSTSST